MSYDNELATKKEGEIPILVSQIELMTEQLTTQVIRLPVRFSLVLPFQDKPEEKNKIDQPPPNRQTPLGQRLQGIASQLELITFQLAKLQLEAEI